jgi:[acyl-carrier-protein] S-malonyltransferase
MASEVVVNKSKQRAVVICPGRGTYNKEELGYFHRLHSDKKDILTVIDAHRLSKGQTPVAELDSQDKYSMRLHSAGENASSLIYACAQGDFQSIDTDQYDIVAVTGNSMGWYIALAVSGALAPDAAIELINTMGSMMTNGVIGGQLIYPVVDDNWQRDEALVTHIRQWMTEVNQSPEAEVHDSIYLGGYLVIGGNQAGLDMLSKLLPPLQDRYPMQLFNHAAFHTPMLQGISDKAKQLLAKDLFQAANLPLIDGRGKIWQPYSTDLDALYDYTLGSQVVDPYDFSAAIEVALKDFAPDKLIILGPGATLGGAVGQCLVANRWHNINNKTDFITCQKSDPFVLAMGMEEQRKLVTG